MSDCDNVEMRELLPELMLGTLPSATREGVEEHVTSCRDCAEELGLLHTAKRVMGAVPFSRIDTAAIVRALPSPSVVATTRYRSGNVFRIAAAISFLSLGGVSLAVARSFFDGRSTIGASDSSDVALPLESMNRIAGSLQRADTPVAAQPGAFAVGSGVSELDTADLHVLYAELERLEAAPFAEPDNIPGGRVLPGALDGREE